MTLNPGVRAHIEAGADTARLGNCPRCAAPVYRARVGRVAAVDVVTDTTPLDLTGELAARLAGRLTWRAITGAYGTTRLAWRDVLLIPHARAGVVLADHKCPTLPVQERLL